MAKQELHALVVGFLVAALDYDFLVFATVDLNWRHRLDKCDGFGDARLQVGQRLLVVLVCRDLHAGQARHHAFGCIAGDLHLLGHGQHVGEQAIGSQRGAIELLGVDMGLRLVEDVR